MIFVEIGGPQEIHAISEAKKDTKKILTCCIVQSLKFTNFATPGKRGFPQYEKRRNKNKRKRKVIKPN